MSFFFFVLRMGSWERKLERITSRETGKGSSIIPPFHMQILKVHCPWISCSCLWKCCLIFVDKTIEMNDVGGCADSRETRYQDLRSLAQIYGQWQEWIRILVLYMKTVADRDHSQAHEWSLEEVQWDRDKVRREAQDQSCKSPERKQIDMNFLVCYSH